MHKHALNMHIHIYMHVLIEVKRVLKWKLFTYVMYLKCKLINVYRLHLTTLRAKTKKLNFQKKKTKTELHKQYLNCSHVEPESTILRSGTSSAPCCSCIVTSQYWYLHTDL